MECFYNEGETGWVEEMGEEQTENFQERKRIVCKVMS